MHGSEELGRDCLLSLWRGVDVGVGGEEATDAGMQVGRSRDVQGAWVLMDPKRRSQVACGFAHSACDHWALTQSKKLPRLGPFGDAVAGEKGLDVEGPLFVGKRSEEGVISSAGGGAEVQPSSPDSVSVFVASFLFGVEDEAAVCSTCETQDKISLGSGEILNLCGI